MEAQQAWVTTQNVLTVTLGNTVILQGFSPQLEIVTQDIIASQVQKNMYSLLPNDLMFYKEGFENVIETSFY